MRRRCTGRKGQLSGYKMGCLCNNLAENTKRHSVGEESCAGTSTHHVSGPFFLPSEPFLVVRPTRRHLLPTAVTTRNGSKVRATYIASRGTYTSYHFVLQGNSTEGTPVYPTKTLAALLGCKRGPCLRSFQSASRLSIKLLTRA